ncbi:MAG: Signal peptidase I [Gemmatimonadaceae bacterium]|nr:Signal peptidase I [Gemmatimonadaceae bacterium]
MAKSTRKAKKPNVVAAARAGKGGSRPSRGTVWENVKGIGSAILIFLFIRAFFFEAYRIPSGSMIPALLVGDWLFVNKMVYGPHVPFTSVNLPGYAEPKRYEVVVFQSPYQIDQPEDPTPTLVKRLVGMPGDTLHMRDAKLFINGIEQRQGYGASSEPGDPNETSPLFDWQKQVALTSSRFGPAPSQPTHDNWGPLVIPAGHYFMMGDNRYQSKDSRYWGLVPRENMRGRPTFVYYSWNADDSDRPLPFLTDIRWSRIGHWIK